MRTRLAHVVLAALTASALMSGCTAPVSSTPSGAASAAAISTYPMTFTNCGTQVTVPKKPERIVTLNGHVTEIVTALGAGDRIVGIAYADNKWLPELAGKISTMKKLSDKYPTWEQLLEIEPDLVVGGMNSSFNAKEGRDRDRFHQNGIATYKLNEYCGKGFRDMSMVYDDITELGKILDVPEKAAALNASIREPLDRLQTALKDTKPVTTFFYDSGTDTAMTIGGVGAGHVIATLAGTKSISDDGEKPYVKIPWERVAEANPELIVILDYGQTSADAKRAFLESHPLMSKTPAVKNKRFVVVPLADMFESQRLVNAAYTVAKAAHPDETPAR